MTTDAPWTVKRLLEWTTDYLSKHGADSPRLDAEVLLSHALGWPRIQLYVRYEECPPDEKRVWFREAIKERAKGRPVAYLTGEKEFFSLRFRVTPAVLIPRPETEFLVVAALDVLRREKPSSPRILDLCTGSGAVVVAIGTQYAMAELVATDISAAALEVARDNAEHHDLNERIEFREGDLWAGVAGEQFDLIVANPPYIGLRERESLMTDVVAHEPELALFSGDDGMACTERIIAGAAEHLRPGGWLFIETSPLIANALFERIQATPKMRAIEIKKDLAGHPRILVARRDDLASAEGERT